MLQNQGSSKLVSWPYEPGNVLLLYVLIVDMTLIPFNEIMSNVIKALYYSRRTFGSFFESSFTIFWLFGHTGCSTVVGGGASPYFLGVSL